ncbi:hypothetical protein LAZ67_14002392 [Cordylochernes scorpioides]|uniref:Uncharacterized protein n=1 Tax=Cordylochernes scorpioides TaxID=51811 RepID=A0ABY6L6W7_9ARAC|nr:hypothetical protein LAZ67_14002392 [Cordylochernes scorpioides]
MKENVTSLSQANPANKDQMSYVEWAEMKFIKFNTKLGKRSSETFILMKQVYSKLCLSKSNVFIWHKWFLSRRNTLDDDKHTG